jgi:two-component system, OmpR family, sensor kinase
MMASLRARLLVGLLAPAAVGLLLLGGVTYAEQRSFLIDRANQQARSAFLPMSRQLDNKLHVGGQARRGRPDGDEGPGGGGPPPPGGPPTGTYAERRTATGTVLGYVVNANSFTTQNLALPKIPARLRLGHTFTVGSKGSSLRYRVYAARDFDDSGITVVAVPLREVDQTLTRLLRVEGLLIAGVLLALAAAALAIVRLGLRPLDRMAAVAGEIAAGRLSKRVSPATSKTEVGRLGLALNGMLARLEKAFAEREESEERLRQFLSDASHELRTPLSSIRGYSELFRIGAASSPEDRETAMKRIEEEAARMGVLVEDLLTLARLDEVREVERHPVDLARIARDAVDDARVIAPDRDIEIEANGPTIVAGDPHQLRQVLGNLMRNALVHTPPGTPVEVAVSVANGEAAVEVRDHGPGLPGTDPDKLFERFWRAERGRGRGKGGSGLGLAIVGEIVDAHGGRVEAGDAEGGGARFVIRLPAGG